MSLPWITNRLPTEADADEYGMVVVFGFTSEAFWSTILWSNVEKFQPWLKFEPLRQNQQEDEAQIDCSELQLRHFKTFYGSPETDHSVETRYAVAEDGTAWYKKGNGPWQQEKPLPECAKLTNPNQDKHE